MGTAALRYAGRAAMARRGRQLEIFTILWGVLEASIALTAAVRGGSISLAGFGFDSLIEVVSALALFWRMSHEMNEHRRHHAEHTSLRVAGGCLLALALYILLEAPYALWRGHHAETGWLGIAVTTAALLFMPVLAKAKRRVGRALGSTAMMMDARQTDFCMYQAAIVLFGLLVHLVFRITWADSVAALLLVPFLLRAGVLSLRGQSVCVH
ncbi:MAG TPA: cation transporter [Edaphobacter sp.]|nr:cation transporter [Edaphobacter sp.]